MRGKAQLDIRRLCLQLLQDPPTRLALERLARQPDLGVETPLAERWITEGLCEGSAASPRLTQLGRSLAYHLAEYRSQIEDGDALRFVAPLDVQPDSRVLDIGCGGGQSLIALLRQGPRLGVGLEWDPTALGIFTALRDFEQIGNALPVRGNAEVLPFADCSFDRILCRVVLMHVRVLPALAEIARVCAEDGLVWLHLTDFWFYWRKFLRLRWEHGGVPFALLNGFLLQIFGTQIPMRATRTMSYQTPAGIARRLEGYGFEILAIEEERRNRLATSHRQPKILARLRRSGQNRSGQSHTSPAPGAPR
ncbi:MAG: class I SAM-dependent methyltransferase [Acidobacteriota bacterium]